MLEDSSDDEPLTRVNSGPKLYEIVPYDKLFKLKIVRKNGEKIKFEYLLKEGRPLPYQTVLEGGFQFLFTRDLDIQMAANELNWRKEFSPMFTVFTENTAVENPFEKSSSSASVPEQVIASCPISAPSCSSSTVRVPVNGDISILSEVLSEDDAVKIGQLLQVTEDTSSVVCLICGHMMQRDEDLVTLSNHIIGHDGWREYNVVSGEKSKSSTSSSASVFLNPDWKKQLFENFDTVIISKCSQETRLAWTNKEEIQNKEKFTSVRFEIIKELKKYLMQTYGTVSLPTEEKLKEIVQKTLTVGYPYMFGTGSNTASENEELASGYGRGGIHGIKHLPRQIRVELSKEQNKLRREELKANEDRVGDEEADESLVKKGRTKQKFGINNAKFYAKASSTQIENVEGTVSVESASDRETIYSRNRPALCQQIRVSGKIINRVVRGFFLDPVHIKNHFHYLTGVDNLRPRLAENWDPELQKMELYLRKKDSKGKYLTEIKEAEQKVQVEYDGSNTYKEMVVIRSLTSLIDKSGHGRSLICLEGEDFSTSSPFLLAKEVGRSVYILHFTI